MWASLVNLIAPEPTADELLVASLQRGSCDELQEALQQRGADAIAQIAVQDGEVNLFQLACWYGNAEAAKLLFDLGLFDVNAATPRARNTAAHLAAMNGHAWLVIEYLVAQLSASVAQRNAKAQSVYDACPSTQLELKQALMTLLLQEEQRTGTAPDLSTASITMTRDKHAEEERLRNLPPPPIISSTSTPTATLSPPPPPVHHIQPDGFVTTVGNPELAHKYGNVQVQSRLHQPSSSSQQQPPQPVQAVTRPPPPPFAANAPARYVPVNVTIAPPSSRPPPSAQFRPLATSGAKVFTPQQPPQ